MKKIYLATAFSGIEDLSFKYANEVASLLIDDGYFVFSPISHSYPIWKTEMVPHTHDVWLRQDKAFVEWADEIFVIRLINVKGIDGNEVIRKSKGVGMEIAWAVEMGKPVTIIDYDVVTRLYDISDDVI